MRTRFAAGMLALGLLAAPRVGMAQAAEYDNRNMNGCVRTFYDPEFYHWLSFKNVCGETITVVFGQMGANHYVEGATTIRPGRSSNTGLSRSEVGARGGLSWYVCAEGYVPLVNGSYPTRTGERFNCKRE